jgi:ABC-2 type transport system ATP-binding protein
MGGFHGFPGRHNRSAGLAKTYKTYKTYKTKRGTVDAVRSVDLTVQAGEIVGFLRPNGAGKPVTGL